MQDLMANMFSPQMIVVLIIALLLFGGNRIPETMRGLGKGLKEFKKGLNEEDEKEEEKTAKSQ